MRDIISELPPWVPISAVVLVILATVSGSGIWLLNRLDAQATPSPIAQQMPPPTTTPMPTATPLPPAYIPLGGSLNATATTTHLERTFTVEAQAGDFLHIEVDDLVNNPSSHIIRLYTPDGILLERQSGWVSQRIFDDGLYRVRVISWWPGDYTIYAYTGPTEPIERLYDTVWQTSEQGTLTAGDRISGTLTTLDERQAWTLPVAAGDRLRIQLEGEALLYVTLPYDDGAFQLYEGSWLEPEQMVYELEAPVNAELTVYVLPRHTTGNFTLSVEAVETVTYYDYTSFAGRGNTVITHRYHEAGDRLTLPLNFLPEEIEITIRTPTGDTLPPDTIFIPDEERAHYFYTLPETGVYTFIHTPLTVDSLPSMSWNTFDPLWDLNPPDTISVGETIRATLPSYESHRFTMQARAGQGYILTLNPQDTTVEMRITGPTGEPVDRTYSNRLVFTPEVSGEYDIHAYNDSARPDNFALTLEENTTPYELQSTSAEDYTLAYSRELTVGETLTQRIERADYRHDYTVTGVNGRVTVEFIPLEGTQLCISRSSRYCGIDEVFTTPIDEDTTFFVRAHEGQTGSYSIRVYEGNPPFQVPTEALSLEVGETLPVNKAGYTFEAHEGELIMFEIHAERAVNGRQSGIIIRDPEGYAYEPEDEYGVFVFRANRGGLHLMEVELSSSGEVVPYTIQRVEEPYTVRQRGIFAAGDQVATSLEARPVIDEWQLNVEAGQLVTLWWEAPLESLDVEIIDETTSESITFEGNPYGRPFVPQEGHSYVVKVYWGGSPYYNSAEALHYNMWLGDFVGLPITQTITLNPEDSGESLTHNTTQRWLLNAEAGQRQTVTVSERYMELVLLDPNGNIVVIEPEDDRERDVMFFDFVPSMTGVYTLYVYDNRPRAYEVTYR